MHFKIEYCRPKMHQVITPNPRTISIKLGTLMHASGPKMHRNGMKHSVIRMLKLGQLWLWLGLIQDNKTTKYNHVLKQTVANPPTPLIWV